MSEREVWRPIEGFDLYDVSNLGRVRSKSRSYERGEWRHGRRQVVNLPDRILRGWIKQQNDQASSVQVALRCDGRTHEKRVHRLVLTAFLGPPPPGQEGCHNDGDPTNNRLSNLRWDTHAANVADSVRHGTKTAPPRFTGERHANHKLSDAAVATIRATPILRGAKARLAREHGVSQQTIGGILAGQQRRPDK